MPRCQTLSEYEYGLVLGRYDAAGTSRTLPPNQGLPQYIGIDHRVKNDVDTKVAVTRNSDYPTAYRISMETQTVPQVAMGILTAPLEVLNYDA